MAIQKVNVDNFARIESDEMFFRLIQQAEGLGKFHHDREPAPISQQPIIRQNRDTLYSFAVADISQKATLTVPEYGDRYLSVMIVNQDHYVNRVIHSPGTYLLTVDEFDTEYAMVAARILFDPNDSEDLEAVHAIQDDFMLENASSREFAPTLYDPESYKVTRRALLALASELSDFKHAFGRKGDVDPVYHLIGAAAGWGGLPDSEAAYIGLNPKLPRGRYKMTFADVPANAFWSLSVYDTNGYFEENVLGSYNVNSVFGVKNDDGSITVLLGDFESGYPNVLPLPEGWNLLIRLYQPQFDRLKNWKIPEIEKA